MDTAADLIERDITPILQPGSEIWISYFANSQNPNYQEISRKFVIAKDYDEYDDMVLKVISTGLYAEIGTEPWWLVQEEDYKDWYRSSERIPGNYQYQVHLTNKKWPLKKVLKMNSHFKKIILQLFTFRNMTLIF